VKRGEIWMAGFDPSFGTEAAKTRPCVVVSADDSNQVVDRLGRGVVTVVPLTTNVQRVYPFQVLIPATEVSGLATDSKAQAEQIRALDHGRFTRRVGVLTAEQVAGIDDALMIHLSLAG